MAKYKICPSCGKKNPPTVLECEDCEADISTVRVTDDTEAEKPKAKPAAPERAQAQAPAPAKVRICDGCGMKNPANARKCSRCGEDISDIMPTSDASGAAQEPKRFVLESLDGEMMFPIPEGDAVLGREAEMAEYLEEKVYVSRQHACLHLHGGKLSVENLKSTNSTYVNNQRVPEGGCALKDGDEIGLGGNITDGKRQDLAAYFRVKRM